MADKKELLRLVGSMQQLAYVRPVTFEEGRARGMRAFEIKNGSLKFSVTADKCLDLTEVSFCGHNVSFLAKPGLMGTMIVWGGIILIPTGRRRSAASWAECYLPAGLKISARPVR